MNDKQGYSQRVSRGGLVIYVDVPLSRGDVLYLCIKHHPATPYMHEAANGKAVEIDRYIESISRQSHTSM